MNDYFLNRSNDNPSFFDRPSYRCGNGYAVLSKRRRRPGRCLLAIFGGFVAVFFWTLGFIKWFEICEKWVIK
jgi:hypothetical protein